MNTITRFCAIACAIACAALTGCAAIPQQETRIDAAWDGAAAAKALQPGPNTVAGSAFMRQQGGGVVTCAGSEVSLVPATPYAAARMRAIYGGIDAGINRQRPPLFAPDVPAYHATMRKAKCDAQGAFMFGTVADGEYFITVIVQWTVGYVPQGGALMQRVTVANGAVARVVMSA